MTEHHQPYPRQGCEGSGATEVSPSPSGMMCFLPDEAETLRLRLPEEVLEKPSGSEELLVVAPLGAARERSDRAGERRRREVPERPMSQE